jgi:hypothetical protein
MSNEKIDNPSLGHERLIPILSREIVKGLTPKDKLSLDIIKHEKKTNTPNSKKTITG